ncbi:MAG: cyclic peptide export ABC transporter, partial [Alphaproteobacteria bacterium]|nr:cyclic peptide export ABC transporter [Alphaproteobacteria bacterium]
LRNSLTLQIRQAELIEVESLNTSEVYTMISRETKVIADAAPQLMIAVQSLVLVGMIMLYLSWLSTIALSLMGFSIVVGAWIHLHRIAETSAALHDAIKIENTMVSRFADLLNGFKEIKLSGRRSAALGEALSDVSATLVEKKVHTQGLYTQDFIASQVTFFLMTGVVVFVAPMMAKINDVTLGMITTASLFLIGPVSGVVMAIPLLGRANAAAEAVAALKQRLSRILSQHDEPQEGIAPFKTDFAAITLDNLSFHHRRSAGEEGFKVGPINLSFRRGQIVFITGGNGSGKSTLLKLLTALYRPETGSIHVDDRPVTGVNIDLYREMFAVVFADNHLFDTLWGQEQIDPEEVAELFVLLEMQDKVRLDQGRFSTTQLSGGQKKRLALIGALLEHRAVYVFDEWAADQDPHFRRKFYHDILPRLRQAGKTVIAVTHDDKYFDVADVRIHIDSGEVADIHTRDDKVSPV